MEAIELVCHEQKGHSLEQMAAALMTTFLEAKMRDAKDKCRPVRGKLLPGSSSRPILNLSLRCSKA
jgi:hypothetical protein